MRSSPGGRTSVARVFKPWTTVLTHPRPEGERGAQADLNSPTRNAGSSTASVSAPGGFRSPYRARIQERTPPGLESPGNVRAPSGRRTRAIGMYPAHLQDAKALESKAIRRPGRCVQQWSADPTYGDRIRISRGDSATWGRWNERDRLRGESGGVRFADSRGRWDFPGGG